MVNFVKQLGLGLIVFMAIGASAGTNQLMQLEYRLPTLHLAQPEAPENLWERFEFAFEQRAKTIFVDRFHPLNTTQWYLSLKDLSPDEFRDYPTHTARKALSRSGAVSAREAAFELPVMLWLDGQRGFLLDLLMNSVDSIEEEALAPLSPAYRDLERSWWRRLADNKNLSFGLRPFRTSPYAFMSASIWNGDSLVMLTHMRYHYSDFADHQFEFAVSVPLTPGLSIDVGTAYHINRHDEAKRMVLKLSKQFKNGGAMHIGMEAQEQPKFLAGIALPL